MAGKEKKRILVVNPFGVGDVLFTTPVVRALKRHFPGSFLGYLCSRRSAPVLKHNPHVDALFFFSRGDFKNAKKKSVRRGFEFLTRAVRELRRQKFALAVDLSLVSQYAVLMWIAGIKERWGFDYRKRGRFLTHKVETSGFTEKHVVDYYADLLNRMGIGGFERNLELFVDEASRAWAGDFLRKHESGSRDALIGISACGGASWGEDAENKRWPAESFAEIGRRLLEQSRNIRIILLGTKEEEAAVEKLERLINGRRVINAAGKTTLERLAGIIERCALLIGNDSGLLHMANAIGTKSAAIFGPVDEKIYGPVGKTSRHLVVGSAVVCRPCYRDFKAGKCRAANACLKNISVETVWNAVQKLLLTDNLKDGVVS